MGWASLNTKQAWVQASENGKVIYGPAGGQRSGPWQAPSRPLHAHKPLSCNQRSGWAGGSISAGAGLRQDRVRGAGEEAGRVPVHPPTPSVHAALGAHLALGTATQSPPPPSGFSVHPTPHLALAHQLSSHFWGNDTVLCPLSQQQVRLQPGHTASQCLGPAGCSGAGGGPPLSR